MKNIDNNTTENESLSLALPQSNVIPTESLLQIALRNRWIILSTVILFLFVGFVYLLKATPIYSSTTELYIEQNGPKIISGERAGGVLTESKNYLYTQAELIKSTPIVAGVADDPQITRLRTFANVDNLVGYIKRNLSVAIGRRDDIIRVSLYSPYPQDAAQIVNAVVESYIRYHRTRKRSTASQVLDILQKEKVKRDSELKEKYKEMLEFTRDNGVVSFQSGTGHFAFEMLNRLSATVAEAQLATINAKADLESAKRMSSEPAKLKQFAATLGTGGTHIPISNVETKLLSELQSSEVELENARRHCTDDHPSIQLIRTKIDHINQKLNKQAEEFAASYVEVLQLRRMAAKQRENELQESFEEQRETAHSFGAKAVEYSALQSELKRTERLCDILNDRIKELNVTEDIGVLSINVLEVARPAGSPAKPQKAKVMAIALVLSFMFSGGLTLLREWLDYRLRSTEEISAILGVPVLGVVPAMSKKQTAVARGQKVYLKPKSIVAEACRTIRTAVFFGLPKGKAKIILITSPAAGDGKTTIVSNLAIAMAQAGQKTLIIDADLRHPMQHNIFEIDRKKGLASMLAVDHTGDGEIQSGPVEGLDLLPCGPEVPNPAEMLNSDLFAQTLKNLSERYDRIIIDAPPIGPVADSQILAAICDTTLLVLRAERSTRKQSQRARDSLLSVGGHILGAVVNDVSRKHSRYGYGYYGGYSRYGHYGYYGESEKKKEDE